MQPDLRKIRPAHWPLRLAMASAVFAASWAVYNSIGVKAASPPNFNSDIAPILQKNCLACHSSSAKMGGLVMDSYDSLMKGGDHGQVILPHDSHGSRLSQMLEGKISPRMPFGADPLPAAD